MIINTTNLEHLRRGYQSIFQKVFAETPSVKDKLATTVKSNTKVEDYGWINALPKLREWLGDRQIKDLSAGHYALENKEFELTVGVMRDDIEDDRYGIYNVAMQELAKNAKEHPQELLFQLIAAADSTACFDGQYFLDTDHPVGSSSVSNFGGGVGELWMLLDTSRPLKPFIYQERRPYAFQAFNKPTDANVFNERKFIYGVDARCNAGYGLWQLAYGSKATLDATAFNAARAAMRNFKNDEGQPLNVQPTVLVVGPDNEAAALAIIAAETSANGASNINYKAVELIVTPYL